MFHVKHQIALKTIIFHNNQELIKKSIAKQINQNGYIVLPEKEKLK